MYLAQWPVFDVKDFKTKRMLDTDHHWLPACQQALVTQLYSQDYLNGIQYLLQVHLPTKLMIQTLNKPNLHKGYRK
jgi:hypothetical protein